MVTPTAFEVFELLESDLGRPITHFAPFLSFGRNTINDLTQKALEGQRQHHHGFTARQHPPAPQRDALHHRRITD